MQARRPCLLAAACSLLCLCVATVESSAQDNARRSGPRAYGSGFDNPSGIAVQPETGHVFVAERRGVYRLTPQQPQGENEQGKRPKRKFLEINGFPGDIYGKGPMYDIGPLGVAFLDKEHLVVGDGSRPDGQELAYVFKVGTEPAQKPQKEKAALHKLGPIEASDQTVTGEGNFYGVAIVNGAAYFTLNGDDTKGWIGRAQVAADKSGPLELHIATKPKVLVDAPVAITVNDKQELVVGQMGEVTQPGDSLLTIYDPESGELKKKYETGLSDIAGLAYSPQTGRLYAVDFAWHDASQGGLFELTVSGDKCTANKILSLDKPTSMAFDDDGNLYVAVFGTAQEADKQKPGKVYRINARRLARGR